MTIKNIFIDYDAINAPNIFSNGDTINGRITVEVLRQVKIKSLTFTAKGKARVCWSEHYGQYTTIVYHAKEKYFKIEHAVLRGALEDGTEIIGPGKHVFPFTFKIPDREMPSTFKAWRGKIVYFLEARLSRSMKIQAKAKTKFIFVSKADMTIPRLMEPQYGCKDKDVVFFPSGKISLNVYTEKMGYLQGEQLKVIVEVTNSSTRKVKPKFYLYKKESFFAQGQRRVETKDVLKDKSDQVPTSSRHTVTKIITIPPELPPSILNCSIIKLEYRLKVMLDVTLTKNPEIKLPIIVRPYLDGSATKEKAFL